jgi:hypothetical protein
MLQSQHIAIELVLTIMGRGRQQSCILSEHTNDEVTPIAHSEAMVHHVRGTNSPENLPCAKA